MYLKNIKLAGFKSFVDVTTIPIRSHMSAIVGPNGCGKSNIVDAVRWVIGEISAKQLRGQSMSDVIFNGTSTRKPVGKAMVELAFENDEGRIGGEFAKYNEISIRREVEREGQSNYFINGMACRRKDILDIFLGTGLGPRSYAIIEQGMVTRLIEAKPDEMRVYLEEAAGISKYKERRRETENRIARTHENLDRLNDLREELAKQLRHLKRQANAAERYQDYKKEERLIGAQIKALQWRDLSSELEKQDTQIREQQLLHEEKRTELRHIETEIEKGRLWQVELTEKQNGIQKEYYGLGAEIARIEQQIQNIQQQIKQWKTELEETENLWKEVSDNSMDQQQQIQEISSEIENLAPKADEIQNIIKQSQEKLIQAEQLMQEWQQQWETFQNEYSHNQQSIEVTKTKIEHYEQQEENLKNRIHDLRSHRQEDAIHHLEKDIDPLKHESEQMREELEDVKENMRQIAEAIATQRQKNVELNHSIESARQELQELQSRYASLDALQKIALGEKDDDSNQWLTEHQLQDKPRLGKLLKVNPGWELAAETVLSGYFDAVCVDNIEEYIYKTGEKFKGNLTLIANDSSKADPAHANKGKTLASQINENCPIADWVSNIFIAEDISEAMQLRRSLLSHESIITKDGVWISKHWLRVSKANNDEGGVILREQELEKLKYQIEDLQNNILEQQEELINGEKNLNELEEKRDQQQANYQDITARLTDVQAQLSAKQSRLIELQQQQERMTVELQQCEDQIEQFKHSEAEAKQLLDELQKKQSDYMNLKERLSQKRTECEIDLNESRRVAQQDKQTADEIEIRLTSNQNQLAILQQSVSRAERQQQQLSERRDALISNLSDKDGPIEQLSQELQKLLGQRQEIEQRLHEAENELQVQNQQLKEQESERSQLHEIINQISQNLQELKLQRQTIHVCQTNLIEQIKELEFECEKILEELPDESTLVTSQEKADQIARKISRLGPINLAAIEEHKSINERKEYLDKQVEDLDEALRVLQNAIRKIDKETREKFRVTYDRVNEKFQNIFPRIFGGGRATLELEGDDLLTTGVVVRAQPPGKKNVSIHMLSGGEKALTAISLVFSLFQLNPAPFCVLDEVDAPLDDVNVSRYCQLVKEMSQQTQFIVISHNKVTIEAADHLMGVTMQEAGVSRIVSVDMAQAIEMASEAAA